MITATEIPQLRKGKWTEPELATLRELYDHTVAEEIARILGRTVSGVYQQAIKLGIVKQGVRTEAEGPIARFTTRAYRRCPGCGAMARFVAPGECLSCFMKRMG